MLNTRSFAALAATALTATVPLAHAGGVLRLDEVARHRQVEEMGQGDDRGVEALLLQESDDLLLVRLLHVFTSLRNDRARRSAGSIAQDGASRRRLACRRAMLPPLGHPGAVLDVVLSRAAGAAVVVADILDGSPVAHEIQAAGGRAMAVTVRWYPHVACTSDSSRTGVWQEIPAMSGRITSSSSTFL